MNRILHLWNCCPRGLKLKGAYMMCFIFLTLHEPSKSTYSPEGIFSSASTADFSALTVHLHTINFEKLIVLLMQISQFSPIVIKLNMTFNSGHPCILPYHFGNRFQGHCNLVLYINNLVYLVHPYPILYVSCIFLTLCRAGSRAKVMPFASLAVPLCQCFPIRSWGYIDSQSFYSFSSPSRSWGEAKTRSKKPSVGPWGPGWKTLLYCIGYIAVTAHKRKDSPVWGGGGVRLHWLERSVNSHGHPLAAGTPHCMHASAPSIPSSASLTSIIQKVKYWHEIPIVVDFYSSSGVRSMGCQ